VRPIVRLRAYAAGADAFDRGEPAWPPPTIPSHRMDAWLNGWADQKAFTEHQTARRKRKRAGPGSNRPVAGGDEIAPTSRIRTTTSGRVFGYLRRSRGARRKAQPRRTSLLRVLAVSWWLAVIGCASFALFGTWALWGHYHSSEAYGHYQTLAGWTPASTAPEFIPGPPDPSWHVAAGAVVLSLSLLPFIIVTAIRRIAVGHWRSGPRW